MILDFDPFTTPDTVPSELKKPLKSNAHAHRRRSSNRQLSPVGTMISKLRADNGNMYISQLARLMGLTRAYVCGVELGTHKASNAFIDKICEVFQIDGPQKESMRAEADLSSNNYKLNLKGSGKIARLLGLSLAKVFSDGLSEDKAEKMMKALHLS